jgi:hypothetical protein
MAAGAHVEGRWRRGAAHRWGWQPRTRPSNGLARRGGKLAHGLVGVPALLEGGPSGSRAEEVWFTRSCEEAGRENTEERVLRSLLSFLRGFVPLYAGAATVPLIPIFSACGSEAIKDSPYLFVLLILRF